MDERQNLKKKRNFLGGPTMYRNSHLVELRYFICGAIEGNFSQKTFANPENATRFARWRHVTLCTDSYGT
jgi:hypothetical protein